MLKRDTRLMFLIVSDSDTLSTPKPFSFWAIRRSRSGTVAEATAALASAPIDVQLAGEPPLEATAVELQGLLAGLERAPRDLQLLVQLEQIEVRPRHIDSAQTHPASIG